MPINSMQIGPAHRLVKEVIMRRPLLVVLALSLTVAVGAVPAFAANVALFFDPTYVDTATDGTGEAYNLQQGLIAQGHTVTTFTGTSAQAFNTALAGKSILVIPELQNNNLSPALDQEAAFTISLFVNNGGTLMMFDPGDGDPLAVLNKAFPGFQLTSAGGAVGTIAKAPGAVGTPFENGPATLPINLNATDTILTSSLPASGLSFPASSRVIYADDNGNAVVAMITVGGGHIVVFGWDWFDAAPVGSQDGGWLSVLDTTGNAVVGTQPIPTLSEWAMIAMAALLLVTGVAAMRRQRPLAA
jgi:hypothetical protein